MDSKKLSNEAKRKLPVTRTTQFDADVEAARRMLGASNDAETVRQVLYQWVRSQNRTHAPDVHLSGD